MIIGNFFKYKVDSELFLSWDDGGDKKHCVGTDMNRRFIYDDMKPNEFPPSKDNLSVCCGDNNIF